LEQWREVLETAMQFAADCAHTYRRASRRTRRLFNLAVFDRIEVCDRKLASVRWPDGAVRPGVSLVAPTGFEPALPP
jgi:hypothetical protein